MAHRRVARCITCPVQSAAQNRWHRVGPSGVSLTQTSFVAQMRDALQRQRPLESQLSAAAQVA